MDTPDFSELRRRIVANIEEDLAREASEARTRREAMLPVVTAAIAEARARGACGEAWLFGSFAWGEPGDRSDVDLLVEDCRSPDGLAAAVWTVVDRPVHVVQREHAPASLVERVLREGVRL